MSKFDFWDPVALNVWCGRRDEAHRKQKGGVRRTLVKIAQVEVGKMVQIGIAKDARVPYPCKRITRDMDHSTRYARTGWGGYGVDSALYEVYPQVARFDWEKGRRLWERKATDYRDVKPLRDVTSKVKLKKGEDLYGLWGGLEPFTPELAERLNDVSRQAIIQRVNAYAVVRFPGYMRVTCPVCGTVYRLTLFADVAEWLDKQLGKTRFVSAKHLEKLSLEMLAKLRQAGLLQYNEA